MRQCGNEVRELSHDVCPVACLGDVPFAYANALTSDVRMKRRPGLATDDAALSRLMATAFRDMKARVESG